ncbi:hypothetical protein B0O99DRAFT_744638 [Bisporella sp. PMI_857]|nr:hypothetical protein B0O99DRAFT_744638 [Bisporella sp. PMI_857]
MSLFFMFAFSLCNLASIASAAAQSPASSVETLFNVSRGIELENIAVRSNGALLLTALNSPVLHQYKPYIEGSTSETVVTVPNVNSLFGISEVSPDIFAFAAGNYSRSTSAVVKSFSVWAVNLRTYPPVLSKITDLPNARFLNGLTSLPPPVHSKKEVNATILLSDTILGQIYHIDPTTGALEAVLQSNATGAARPASLQPGVNGLRYVPASRKLYYTNTIAGIFGSIKISITPSASALPAVTADGEWQNIVSGPRGDDFAVASDGTAYLSGNPVNTVFKVTPDGVSSVFLNSTVLGSGPTSGAFGRTWKEQSSLYITTNGIPVGANLSTVVSDGGAVLKVSFKDTC